MLKKSNNTVSLPDWISFLIQAARSAPSADNSQPWHFFWDGKTLDLCLDKLLSLGAEHPAIGLSMGCAIENIIQAAHSVGIQDEALQLFPENNIYLRVDASSVADNLVVNKDLALFARHTNRNPFHSEKLSSDLVQKLGKQTLKGVEIDFFENKDDIAKISTFINQASQARFQNEQIHKWFADSLRFTKQEVDKGDGLDLATLALPPGGRLLLKLIAAWSRMKKLNSIGAYKLFASIEAASFTKCGSIIALYGNWDTPENSVSCGRVMQRTWVTLNENGYAVQPYFVLSDQLYRLKKGLLPDNLLAEVKELNQDASSFFNSKDKQLLMLLRVGKPLRKPEKSLRLQLSEILSIHKQER